MEHPIHQVMDSVMTKIKEMVDVDTIIGNPITTPDGTTIIPVSKVSFGVGSGGSDFPQAALVDKTAFGGGGGAGVTIKPMAFLVVSGGNVKLLQIDENPNSLDKVVTAIPELIERIGNMIKGDKTQN